MKQNFFSTFLLLAIASTAIQAEELFPFLNDLDDDAEIVSSRTQQADDAQALPDDIEESLQTEEERAKANDNKEIADIASEEEALAVVQTDKSRLTYEAQHNNDLYPQDKDEKKDIYLNFEGAELKSFIDYIATIRNMNIIPDKGITGIKISLNFRNPVSRSGAWNVFLTILEMSGFSIVKTKTVPDADAKKQNTANKNQEYIYKIIPKDKKFKQPLPTFIGVKPETLPESDATIRYIAFLNNIPIQEVKPLLQSMLSQPSQVIDQPNVNGFIITDSACVIKSAMRVLEELDQSDIQESVYVMKLKRVNAQDVKTLFDSLITKKDNNPLAKLLGKSEDTAEYFSSGARLIVDNRTNSLIMLGTKPALEKIRSFIVEHVDKELQQAQSPLRVYDLQHTEAKEIAEILRDVTSNQSVQSAAGQHASKYGAVRDGVKYFKNMIFQADKDGNRLLVSCTDDADWELLKDTIKRLDTPQPQVAIQMLIVTVSAKSTKELGGQVRNKYHGQLGGSMNFQSHAMNKTVFEQSGVTPVSLLGNLINAVTAEQGSTLLSLGKFAAGDDGVWGIFKALKKETDATVLSQPFLVATNRSTSKLVVGESTYVATQEAVGTGISGSTEERADTTIQITPQINADGVIRLDLDANISEFIPDNNSSYGRAKQSKQVKTNVTMANGQVLVVGGFMKTKATGSGGQTPIWGSIPVLGWLGKALSHEIEKEYIFVFLCPTILKPRNTPGIGMYTRMNLHQAAKEVEKTIETKKSKDVVYNMFFNSAGHNYSHKIIDYANARYQPNNVDIRYDSYFHSAPVEMPTQTVLRPFAQQEATSETKAPTLLPDASEAPAEQVTEVVQEEETQPEGAVAYNVQRPSKKKAKKAPAEQEAPPALQQTEPESVTIADEAPSTPPPVAMFDIEKNIEGNREKLRSLLAGSSLTERLMNAAPSNDEAPEATDSPEPQEEEPFLLSRRRGIKKFLSTPPAEQVTPADNEIARSKFAEFLGGK